MAVQRVLTHFFPKLQREHVMVRSDNTTVVAYLYRQGGTSSLPLHLKAAEILLWADSHLSSLRAWHVPGVLNVVLHCHPSTLPTGSVVALLLHMRHEAAIRQLLSGRTPLVESLPQWLSAEESLWVTIFRLHYGPQCRFLCDPIC